MDTSLSMFVVLMSATVVMGQRPSFAGTKPIGFPETPNRTTEGLADRFGEVNGTAIKLPIEANGDLELIDRLSKLPIDKQPFWFINWQAYEAHRQKPQTYPQRPNTFIDPIPSTNNANSGSLNSGFANPNSASNSNTAASNSDSTANRFGESDSNSDVKPVTHSSISNENKNEGFDSEVKPVTSSSGSTANSGSTADSATTANYGSTASSDCGSKLEQVIPLVPSPVAPPSAVDEPIVKDTSEKKLYRQYRRPL